MSTPVQRLSALATAQPTAVAQLRQCAAAGRRGSAYLIVGPQLSDVVGLAEAWAQSLVCAHNRGRVALEDACGACPSCMQMVAGSHPDVHRLHPNERDSIGIEAVRVVCSRLWRMAQQAPVKVVICAPATALAVAAQQALLKTLEEPPGDTLFMLLCRSRAALLPTLRSRTQSICLRPVDPAAAAVSLREAGIGPLLCTTLAALCGDDVSTAMRWQQDGAAETLAHLQRAQRPQTPLSDVFAIAADLGRDRVHFDMALALLEVLVHDALGRTLGAWPSTQPSSPGLDPQHGGARLAAMVDRLVELRRHRAQNLNRSLVLGGLLLCLHAPRAGSESSWLHDAP